MNTGSIFADYCEWWPEGQPRPCYAPTLRFTCAEHLPAWADQIQGRYLVLKRDEWEASRSGYRGPMLGG